MRKVPSLLLLPILLLTLTAASAVEPPADKAAGTVDVHLSEYAIKMPDTLPAGPTTFVVHNDGNKTHSFRIEGPGLSDAILAKPVPPQETENLQVTLQPGEYKVYCPVGSHEVKGMKMTLKVTAKP
ncbi:MAG TPA: cupredoxin domain-containing protein [Thermoanaerobaculia bacterium]